MRGIKCYKSYVPFSMEYDNPTRYANYRAIYSAQRNAEISSYVML